MKPKYSMWKSYFYFHSTTFRCYVFQIWASNSTMVVGFQLCAKTSTRRARTVTLTNVRIAKYSVCM